MRILHTEPRRYDQGARAIIESAGEVDYVDVTGPEGLVAALARAPYDAMFVRLGLPVNAEVLAAGPSLRWVVTPTTGLDHIDLRAAEERSVRVISLRGELALLDQVHATAELSWALLLALLRRIPAAHQDVLAGRWRREPYVGEELYGKTLGIVGLGRLGRKVAGFGLAFGMRVLATDTESSALARGPQGVEPCELAGLFEASDVVSIHVPLKDDTLSLIDADRLALLSAGAVLVNTSRGEVIDESALLSALEEGRLAGAALDVLSGDSRWEEDGLPAQHPLVMYAQRRDNLILTPHIGGYGRASIERTRRFVAERFFREVKEREARG